MAEPEPAPLADTGLPLLDGCLGGLSGLIACALAFPEWFDHPSLIVWAATCALLGWCWLGRRLQSPGSRRQHR